MPSLWPFPLPFPLPLAFAFPSPFDFHYCLSSCLSPFPLPFAFSVAFRLSHCVSPFPFASPFCLPLLPLLFPFPFCLFLCLSPVPFAFPFASYPALNLPPPWQSLHLLTPLPRVGLRYLLDLWGGCWRDHQADIQNAEVGLSRALLADGYNIASLQHEYAGLDFRRQPDRLQCKGRLPGSNPTFCCDVPGQLATSTLSGDASFIMLRPLLAPAPPLGLSTHFFSPNSSHEQPLLLALSILHALMLLPSPPKPSGSTPPTPPLLSLRHSQCCLSLQVV